MYPPPPSPRKTFVAILDLLGYKGFLWDDRGAPQDGGLANLYERYSLLLHALDSSTKIDHLALHGERLFGVRGKVPSRVASDTIMLWSEPPDVDYLLGAICGLMVRALGWGCPIRGALAYGDCILDTQKNILIGYPIVDAVVAESRQEWVGVGVLPSAAIALEGHSIVIPYDVPMKASKGPTPPETLRHALAWHWAEETPNAAQIYTTRMMHSSEPPHRGKYENTLAFISTAAQPA